MIGKKGLFGKPTMPGVISGFGGGTFNMDGTQATMPDMQNVPTTAGGAYGNQMPAQEQQKPRSFWQGGDKFTLRDGIAGALAAVGDGLSNWSGGGGGAVNNLLQSRAAPAQQAAALAAEQRARAMEMADFQQRETFKAGLNPPEAPKPKFEQDGAGNVWALDPLTGRQLSDKPVFVDQTERIVNWNGSMVRIPNPFAGQAKGGQSDAPETLPPDFFDRPQGGQPMQAPAQPIRGAETISRQQYSEMLKRRFNGDQRAMNAWMAQNNVIAGN